MTTPLQDRAAADARLVAGAANGLLRALSRDPSQVGTAVDRLELLASRVVGQPVGHFDATGPTTASVEDELTGALAQLTIGLTILTADSALQPGGRPEGLERSVANLERTADDIEMSAVELRAGEGFDAGPADLRPVTTAALQALDDMSESAAVVVTAVLDKTMKPLLAKVPKGLADLVGALDEEASGRLLRWGLRAVRQGLDALLGLVDVPAVERVRDRIDEVLDRLGQGKDAAVVAGWAIGAADVRSDVVVSDVAERDQGRHERLLGDLSSLTERFARLCTLLRRIAIAVTGLATVLTVAGVTAAHAIAVTTLGLVLVLGALIVLGRDYTGSLDLPGRLRGVRLLVLSASDVTA